MTEPRDEIDSWLGREVEPLAPPPGAFDLVHRRARRRKLNQALLAATGVVVVIAGAVLGPTLGPALLSGHNNPQPPAAAVSTSPSLATPRKTPSPSATPGTPAPGNSAIGTGLSDTTSGTSPPDNFRPTSITMVGTAVGAVIGQAGTPGQCSGPVPADCTSLAGTSTYGKSWYGVSAPVTGVPRGSVGVSQLRFLDLQYGWAFGPALQETSDGGRNWTPVPTFGLRVTDLEAAGTHAFVVLASCQGGGSAYASDCSTFSLYSIAQGSTTLQQVKLPSGLAAGALGTAGQPSSASLVIRGVAGDVQAGTGYLLAPSGDILSGSVGGGAWTYAGMAPCTPGAAADSGAPLGAQLTVSGGALLMNCAGGSAGGGSAGGGSAEPKQLWQSSDGAHWSKVSQPPVAGRATSLAATGAGQVVLATTAGIDYSPDGTTWQPATFSGASPQGGFSYVGMTSATAGIALPVDASLGEVFVTSDSGQSWSAFLISGN